MRIFYISSTTGKVEKKAGDNSESTSVTPGHPKSFSDRSWGIFVFNISGYILKHYELQVLCGYTCSRTLYQYCITMYNLQYITKYVHAIILHNIVRYRPSFNISFSNHYHQVRPLKGRCLRMRSDSSSLCFCCLRSSSN